MTMRESEKKLIREFLFSTRRHGEINVPTWNWHIAELIVAAYPKEFGIDNNIKMGSAMFKRDMKRLYLLEKPDDTQTS